MKKGAPRRVGLALASRIACSNEPAPGKLSAITLPAQKGQLRTWKKAGRRSVSPTWAGNPRRAYAVLLRPHQGLLVLEVLHYAHQIHLPETFRSEAPAVDVAPQELLLAKTLIGAASVEAVDWSRYPDRYTQKLTQVIEAKVAGQEIVAPPAGEIPAVINLLEALKESVARVQPAAKKDKTPCPAWCADRSPESPRV
jgi:hypothetical protein